MRHLLACLLLVSACGTDFATSPDGGTGPDAGAAGETYVPLITGDWQLPADNENYVCVRETITRDMYIKAIRPIAPVGTHHTVLMLGPPDKPDGIEDCNSDLIKPAIFASGVGTQPLELPPGVAIHLHPGDQLLLNLHLFNATDAALSGTSGMEIVEADPAEVEHEAGVALAGKAQGLVVGQGETTQTGTCTTPAGSTIFAVAPHMHLLGTHMKVTYNGAPVLDTDYAFDNQRYQLIDPMIDTVAGGKYTVECTYVNHTGDTVYFGESTTNEMCFALTFIYPPPPQGECTR